MSDTKTEQQEDFYGDLERGNAVIYQQARNNILLALTSRTTETIMAGGSTEGIDELLGLLEKLNK